MSLVFGANATDVVNFGSATGLDNLATFTVLAWIYPTTLTMERMIAGKAQWTISISDSATTDLRLFRSRGTQNTLYRTNNAGLATNKWWFVAVSFNQSGGAGEIVNIYTGDLGTVPTERTYGMAQDGSGTLDNDSTFDLRFGNNHLGNLVFQGRIAPVLMFNRVLTLGEIRSLWHRRRVEAGCVLYSELGWNGTGTQPDWSGNLNSGTVTGATVGPDVPLGLPFGFDASLPYLVSAGSPSASESPSVSSSASTSPSASESPSISPSASVSPSTSESPSISPSASISSSASISPSSSASPSPLLTGSVCWGHATGVLEDNTQTFAGNWTGTGSISGSGDAEVMCVAAGEFMESQVVDTGAITVQLLQNNYAAGDTILLRYRDGTTEANCLAASWTNYTAPFVSLGFVQVRIESTL